MVFPEATLLTWFFASVVALGFTAVLWAATSALVDRFFGA